MKKENERPGFMVYFDDWDIARRLLPPEEFAEFFNDVFEYAQNGVLPNGFSSRQIEVFFDSFRIKVEKDLLRYQDICRKRSEAGKKAHEKKQTETKGGTCQPTPESTSSSRSIPNEYQTYYQTQPQRQTQQQDHYQSNDFTDEDLPF